MSSRAIADAVGDRSWRAWAGRISDEDFLLSDLVQGPLRSLRYRFSHRAPKNATCPICFDTPESESEWQRLWCGCIVCRTCCGQWARAALDGTIVAPPVDNSGGPSVNLSCPVCSLPLRACDAANVLAADDALLGEYDVALRDAALRGMRDFRPCPHCAGGGFATFGCISERRLAAQARANALCVPICVAAAAAWTKTWPALPVGGALRLLYLGMVAAFAHGLAHTWRTIGWDAAPVTRPGP